MQKKLNTYSTCKNTEHILDMQNMSYILDMQNLSNILDKHFKDIHTRQAFYVDIYSITLSKKNVYTRQSYLLNHKLGKFFPYKHKVDNLKQAHPFDPFLSHNNRTLKHLNTQ